MHPEYWVCIVQIEFHINVPAHDIFEQLYLSRTCESVFNARMRSMRGSRGGRTGGSEPLPPEKITKNIGFLSNTGPGPL